MALISKFVLLSLFVTLLYIFGLLSFIVDEDGKECYMTYMFEYPQYTKIKLPNGEKFPRYGLYAYSEGRLTYKVRSMKFDGIPVLFIPGNAGSFKQVRSLSSVAMRKAINSNSKYHFDFFTIDYNDELSGLSGSTLEEQTNFLNKSINRILDFYTSQTNSPNSVILIGHSMGGLVAHGLMVNPEIENVELLITLATPHRKPAIILDYYTANYYEEIKRKALTYGLVNRTFITVGGGNDDRIVNSWLTKSNFSSLNVISTTVPKAWLSMDHQSILWCNQLVLVIVRALFDCIDQQTQQISNKHSYRLAAFKHHLILNSGTSFSSADKYRAMSSLDSRGKWIEDLRRQYSVVFPNGNNKIQWYMIRLLNDPKHQALFVQAVNFEFSDWIFACSADTIQGQSRICVNAMHLSHKSKIAPTSRIKRRTFYADLFRIKKANPTFTHIIIRVMPTSEPIALNLDVHNPNARTISVDLPNWYSLTRKTVIAETDREAVRYVLEMPALQHLIQTHLLYVEPISCSTPTHHATASLVVPWANHDTHTYITDAVKKPLVIRLHNSRPQNLANSTAKVFLTLDPFCRYTVSVRNSIFGMLAQMARHYTPMLVANMVAVVLMTYYSQLLTLGETGSCPLFLSALCLSTKPYYLVTVTKLISKIISWGRFTYIFPMPDSQYLIEDNIDFLLLPLLLYLTAVGLVYLITVLFWAVLILSESTVHKFVAKCFTKTFGGALKWSDWLLTALHRIPSVVALTHLILGLFTCGGIALCLGTIYYFLKLTHMCQEYLEGLFFRYIKKVIYEFIQRFFKFTKSKSNTITVISLQTENANFAEESFEGPDNEKINKDAKTSEKEINICLGKEINYENSGDENKTIVKKEDSCEKHIMEGEKCDKEKEVTNLKTDIKNDCNESDDISKDSTENVIRLRNVEAMNTEENLEQKENANKNEETQATEESKSCINDSIHFHFTLFLLWLIVTALNIPSVLTWARNFHFDNTLRHDPSSFPSIVLCLCSIPLWQMEMPKPSKRFYKHLSMFVYGMAILCLVYTPINLYRISYILTAIIAVVTLHQLVAPKQLNEDVVDDTDISESDPVELLNDIKTKLE